MIRTAAWLLPLLLLGTVVDAVAASPTAQCRKDCAAAKRSCVAGAKTLFKTTKTDCGSAVSSAVRKSCKQDAKSTFRSFKQGCGTTLQQCRGCCSTTAQGAATPQGGAGGCNGGGGGGGGGGGSPVDTSSICPGITGGLAAYWDWLNGVFHPLAQVPTAGGFWVPYQHPGYPLLGFRHPPDWTPNTIAAEQTVGVNLLRNDSAALWREFGTWGNVTSDIPTVRALRDQELGGWLQAINNTGQVTTLCVNEETAAVGAGVTASGSNIIVTANGFTLIVKATVTALDGLGGGQILFNTIVARTEEMGPLAFDVFLPIHFQLFVGSTTQDSDGDGIPDSQDNFPNDPTRG
jgi:hypothetical protein